MSVHCRGEDCRSRCVPPACTGRSLVWLFSAAPNTHSQPGSPHHRAGAGTQRLRTGLWHMGWKRRIELMFIVLGLPVPAATQTRPQCTPDEYYRVTQKQRVSKQLNPEFYKPPREPTARTAKPSPRREKVIVCEDEACV